ncbi:MAG: Hint domain-containing protein [Roseovarius sp.]
MDDGSVRMSDQIGPAMPAFEAAFSAFSHGTLIATTRGQVAVEDLEPGMKLQTAEHGAQQIVWIGSMTLMPRTEDLPDNGNLTRIPADSYGMGRPERDLLCGPGARLLMRPVGMGARLDGERALTPAARLADGMNAIAVYPQRPVTVYHICTRRHAVINAGGLSAETFHPGAGFERNMGPNMLSLFLSFFPHIKQPRDFGPLAHARLPLNENDPASDLA